MKKGTANKPKSNNLQLRIASGLEGAAIILGLLYIGIWGYFTLFLSLLVFCLWEFYSALIKANQSPNRVLGIGISIALFSGYYLCSTGLIDGNYLLLIPALILLVFISKLFDKSDSEPFKSIGLTLTGIFYIGFPFAIFNVGLLQPQFSEYLWPIPIGCFFLLWANDSGAYFAGMLLGKRKLFERISPKKTWEGFFGGLILSLSISQVLMGPFTVLPSWKWAIVSAAIVIMGTLGDLVESMFKRSLNLKDSGTLIPGHGGFLDRFDGWLLAMPVISLILLLL
jgi:phosphatidate cytidylyltransferase